MRERMRNTNRASLAEQAYSLIREKILRGQLSFGTPISRRQLASELRISVLPVNEALQRLKNESLVETVPRVGTQVKVPTPQDIRGFYVVREALESQSARLFCQNASPTERQQLKDLAGRLDGVYKTCSTASNASSQQLYDLRNLHMEFHLRIAQCGRCPFLCMAIEKNQILTFNWFLDRLFGYPGLPEQWHSRLVNQLIVPDVEAADRAMREHVRFRMDELLIRLEPFYSLNPHHIARAVREAHPHADAEVSDLSSEVVASE